MSCEHSHSHSHSNSHDDDNGNDHTPPIPTNPAQSLRQYIDFDKLTGLNIEQPNSSLRRVFKEQEERFSLDSFIQSDADSQFILNIPFTGNVRLHSLIIRSDGNPEHCPKSIKLYKNKNIDFESELKPTYTIEQPLLGPLSSDTNDTSENFAEHHLPRSLFQSTTQLTLFVTDNWEEDEDEQTRIYYIELRGQFTSPLMKDPVVTLYEAAANPADHKNLLENIVQDSI